MFIYHFAFIQRNTSDEWHARGTMSSEVLSAPHGEPVKYGTLILAPIHPFLVLPALVKHLIRPFPENPLLDCILFPITNWEPLVRGKALYCKWVNDGWEDVPESRRPVPKEIVMDFEPEADVEQAKRDNIRLISIETKTSDPGYPALREVMMKQRAEEERARNASSLSAAYDRLYLE
jgi:hypothetical protein